MVTVVPSPGAAKEDLVKEAVTPAGKPDQARLTAELKTPLWAEVALSDAEAPCGTVNALAAPVRLKLSPVTTIENGYDPEYPPVLDA